MKTCETEQRFLPEKEDCLCYSRPRRVFLRDNPRDPLGWLWSQNLRSRTRFFASLWEKMVQILFYILAGSLPV